MRHSISIVSHGKYIGGVLMQVQKWGMNNLLGSLSVSCLWEEEKNQAKPSQAKPSQARHPPPPIPSNIERSPELLVDGAWTYMYSVQMSVYETTWNTVMLWQHVSSSQMLQLAYFVKQNV